MEETLGLRIIVDCETANRIREVYKEVFGFYPRLYVDDSPDRCRIYMELPKERFLEFLKSLGCEKI